MRRPEIRNDPRGPRTDGEDRSPDPRADPPRDETGPTTRSALATDARPTSNAADGCPSMLKPSVQVHDADGIMVAEFWDCFRLDPAPVQELRKLYDAHLAAKG